MVQLLLLALWCLELTYGQPVVVPATDHFIAINSSENVTYTCTVSSSRSVVWEVGRSQIRSPEQFEDIEDVGIFIDPSNTMSSVSTITISQTARESLNSSEILVLCLSVQGISTDSGNMFRVVTFRAPSAPGNLQLVPADPTLSLEWERPANVPVEVPVTYQVEINSTDGNGMNFRNVTSSTSLSVHFLEELLAPGQCIMFDFFVSGSNEAGSGDLAMIVDTVPISPDVTNISRSLTVVRVNLQPLEVEISFPPVVPCSSNFLLHNYSIAINGETARVLSSSNELTPSPGDDMLRPTLSPTQLPGVGLDRSSSLTVTACNVVSCKTSTSATLNTTDVQTAEAVFLENPQNRLNRLFLRCSFAGNSQGQGCAVILTLRGENTTERFNVTRSGNSGFLCTVANNRLEAYSSVEAFDFETNGNVGSLGLNVSSSFLLNEEEYIQLTGCREPGDNTAAIVGGVIGGLLGLLIIVIIIVIIVLGAVYGWWCTMMDLPDVESLLKGFGEVEESEGDPHETEELLPEASMQPAPVVGAAAPPPKSVQKEAMVSKDGGEKDIHHDDGSFPLVAVAAAPPAAAFQESAPPKRSKSKEPKPAHERKKYVVVKTKHIRSTLQKQKSVGH